jgi:hypothetical protein
VFFSKDRTYKIVVRLHRAANYNYNVGRANKQTDKSMVRNELVWGFFRQEWSHWAWVVREKRPVLVGRIVPPKENLFAIKVITSKGNNNVYEPFHPFFRINHNFAQ